MASWVHRMSSSLALYSDPVNVTSNQSVHQRSWWRAIIIQLTRSSVTARRTGRQFRPFVSSQCYSREFGFLSLNSYTRRVRFFSKRLCLALALKGDCSENQHCWKSQPYLQWHAYACIWHYDAPSCLRRAWTLTSITFMSILFGHDDNRAQNVCWKNVHSVFNANQLGTSFGMILALISYRMQITHQSQPSSQKVKAISMVTCCKLPVWCYC